jgi:hypothetical protein
MSNTIQLKRSSTQNSIPSTTALAAGELALNTYDGKLFFKKTVGATNSIITLQPFPTGGNVGQYLSLDSSNNLIWIDKPQTITYLASAISMPDPTKGTYNSGNVSSIQTFGDYNIGNYYSINDTLTQPGFIVDVTFTGVVQFNRIVISLAYQVTSGHIVYVELYNYLTDEWEILHQYSGLTNWAQFSIGVISSTPFIDSGTVLLKIYHSSTGNPTHETKFDYIALEDSTQGGQGPKGDRGATGATGPAGGLTVKNVIGINGTVTNTISTVTAINFDQSTGIQVTDQGSGAIFVSLGSSFKTIQVDGQSDVVALGEDTLQLIAGSNISISTNPSAPKSITISSTGGGGGSGTTSPLKTFNILGDFGLLTGTARYYPPAQDTIKSVIMSVANNLQKDLMVGLYRNNQFLQFFTISAGTSYNKYTNLNYIIQTNESYTVNVVSGSGTNLSMSFFNIIL